MGLLPFCRPVALPCYPSLLISSDGRASVSTSIRFQNSGQ